MRFMNFQYVKRFRMELNLARWQYQGLSLPVGYRLVPWHTSLTSIHAEVKYLSFQGGVDAQVFPCLGELEGCQRLMSEIKAKEGFVPEATWLVEFIGGGIHRAEYCATIQAVRIQKYKANVQNIGVLPEHRSRGIGTALIRASMLGLQQVGGKRTASRRVTTWKTHRTVEPGRAALAVRALPTNQITNSSS